MTTPSPVIETWHAVAASRDPAGLDALLAEDVVFRSPAVFTPQEGKAITTRYLAAALVVLGPTLRYVDEWHGADSAVLEFEADLDGTVVHGVDMIRWNGAGQITGFTVMVRPFKGIQRLIELMGAELAR
jgi:hypothetical protein